MNPTKYLFKGAAILATSFAVCLLPLATFAAESGRLPKLMDNGRGGYTLEDFVVHRRTGIDDVKIESDGSFTTLHEDPSTTFTALNSGAGAALNFSVAFAKHSLVMTADGQHNLEIIARAARLIGKDYSFELIVLQSPKQDPSGRRGLTMRRAEVILSELYRYGVNSEVIVSYDKSSTAAAIRSKDEKQPLSQTLRLTIVNRGDELLAVD